MVELMLERKISIKYLKFKKKKKRIGDQHRSTTIDIASILEMECSIHLLTIVVMEKQLFKF